MTLDLLSILVGIATGYVLAILTTYAVAVCVLRVRAGKAVTPGNPFRRKTDGDDAEPQYVNRYGDYRL